MWPLWKTVIWIWNLLKFIGKIWICLRCVEFFCAKWALSFFRLALSFLKTHKKRAWGENAKPFQWTSFYARLVMDGNSFKTKGEYLKLRNIQAQNSIKVFKFKHSSTFMLYFVTYHHPLPGFYLTLWLAWWSTSRVWWTQWRHWQTLGTLTWGDSLVKPSPSSWPCCPVKSCQMSIWKKAPTNSTARLGAWPPSGKWWAKHRCQCHLSVLSKGSWLWRNRQILRTKQVCPERIYPFCFFMATNWD